MHAPPARAAYVDLPVTAAVDRASVRHRPGHHPCGASQAIGASRASWASLSTSLPVIDGNLVLVNGVSIAAAGEEGA